MSSICVVPVNKHADAPRSEVLRYFFFLLFLFRPHWERSPLYAVGWPGWSRTGTVWGTFSCLFPMLRSGVSSAVLERPAQTLRWLSNITSAPVSKEWPYSLSRLCAGLWLRLPVYPLLSLRRSPIATGLEVIGWDKGWLMNCTWLCEVGLRRASLSLTSLRGLSSGKTKSRRQKTRWDAGAAGRWRIRQPTACKAPLLIFCRGFLPYTEGSQLLSSMLASPLPPSFLETYSLSTSSLGCKALCIVISFLVL